MSDKSIWKKALGLFVEFEGGIPAAVSDPSDMGSVMAETRQALNKLDSKKQTPTTSAPLSSMVNNYIPQEDLEKALADQSQSANATSFDMLYDQVCKSSISIFKVEDILIQPELQSLPRETRAKAAAVALRAMGSSVEEVIQDAYLKDQALDQAELTQRQKVEARKLKNDEKIKGVQVEVDSFLKAKNAEIEFLRDENLKIELKLQAWIESKLKEERRIFDVLSHFVADDTANITLGENHPEPAQ